MVYTRVACVLLIYIHGIIGSRLFITEPQQIDTAFLMDMTQQNLNLRSLDYLQTIYKYIDNVKRTFKTRTKRPGKKRKHHDNWCNGDIFCFYLSKRSEQLYILKRKRNYIY